ncbi:hypothetical protein [Bacillus velezensis]|uniref:hypothetical protein n=1 Tax=Bacillus velezensis TaxID=492670 RepID=UPI000F5A5A4D|nr:hypothetical protein [Bacillus velezensis]AZJ44162.1 hypothetical protein EG882_13110 [Bacillus velezensis]
MANEKVIMTNSLNLSAQREENMKKEKIGQMVEVTYSNGQTYRGRIRKVDKYTIEFLDEKTNLEISDVVRGFATIIEEKEEVSNDGTHVIEHFLEEWKKKVYKWYVNQRELFEKEKHKIAERVKLSKEEALKINSDLIANQVERRRAYKEEQKYLKNLEFSRVAKDFIEMHPKYFEKNVKSYLDSEAYVKKVKLLSRIKKEVGQITNAADLYISNNGEINGIVHGEKGSINVETVSAGGINVQCFHYRVLVKPVR